MSISWRRLLIKGSTFNSSLCPVSNTTIIVVDLLQPANTKIDTGQYKHNTLSVIRAVNEKVFILIGEGPLQGIFANLTLTAHL